MSKVTKEGFVVKHKDENLYWGSDGFGWASGPPKEWHFINNPDTANQVAEKHNGIVIPARLTIELEELSPDIPPDCESGAR